ncbi:MAG TPA: HAD family hydrolase [Ilumatobacter sp.]|nr:HAD family hydrolase [Ilumatobacter sp.]
MQPARDVRAVLFDFFGTLVTYQPDRLHLDYPDTALMLHRWGYENAGERFAEVWNAVLRTLELTTSGALVEFSMNDVVTAYDDTEQLGLTEDQRSELLESFMREWNVGVLPIDGVCDVLDALGDTVQLGIVANTHDPALIPSILDRFHLAQFDTNPFDPIVLSVTHGHRKPHPSIYVAAFDALAAQQRRTTPDAPRLEPADVLFVGDTYDADYTGPLAAGFQARLIDPGHRHRIPDEHRLQSVLDLPNHV